MNKNIRKPTHERKAIRLCCWKRKILNARVHFCGSRSTPFVVFLIDLEADRLRATASGSNWIAAFIYLSFNVKTFSANK